ncbi:MAG TPA: uracil-DNA glycosylase, partial [Rhodothermia bacterium]|nr:uracil-DNA glycosylase [Rhodothermia bacterium]
MKQRSLPSLISLVRTEVFPAASSDRLFNFYLDKSPDLDLADGPEIRRRNLCAYLEAAPERPELLLLAEAPGPRGCRFSGVPFTSEAQLNSGFFPFEGRQSSAADVPWTEYSANIVWGLLRDHFERVLIWNTVPLHPHREGRPLSIRTPSASEVN